jgi:peptide subunit release factor 1 (eRF1)
MAKTSSGLETSLRDRLERLAAFEPQGSPVISLYLNLTPDQHGRDHHEAFCRKAFAERLKTFKEHSPERDSFERDVERINAYLSNELNRSANGLAIFASAGSNDFFDALQLDAPVEEHWLFIGAVPHIYPLARLVDQYPRYATVMLDTAHAQIFVFGLGTVEKRTEVNGVKTRRSSMGGWSQARYQRRADNFHLHHVKEVVDTLDRTVRDDNIQHIIVSGDEVAVPLLKEALPPHLREKLLDIVKLDRHAVEHEIAQASLEALRQKDAETDQERVQQVIDAWRAGALGVAGPEAALQALQMGQVEELLIAATPQELKPVQKLPDDAAPPLVAADTSAPSGTDAAKLRLSDELVARAGKTGARIRMIENADLLRDYGGVAALLRFRI